MAIYQMTNRNENLSISMLDSKGMIMEKHRVNFIENESFPINVSTFAHGIYFLQLIDNEKSTTNKIIIQH